MLHLGQGRETPNSEMLDMDTIGDYEFTLEDEVIAYDEVKKLYVALDKLDPINQDMLKRYYVLDFSTIHKQQF